MIEVRGLACDTPEGRPLLEGLDLDVARGGTLLVTGASGSGKSRLLKAIAGIEAPRAGGVKVAGGGRVRMGFAFAEGGLLSNLSLAENLALPLRFLGLSRAEAHRRAEAALDRLDLRLVADLRPHAVGASARKRANLARVLALAPDLILLDDPLEGLDAADRATALALILGWAADPEVTLLLAAEDAAAFPGLEAPRLELRNSSLPAEAP
ncbi:ATP-binding cassette domain-containing protein [Geothrix sp. 21YS21S-4]|uniref:ATP-binding cassette domain-containing protein n=1 Tax=Geothrix sp. 21YS21S-4 TaxID=3068889 RepID=UPI0027B8EA15|nr:ATP-binding cassette domain-containing protein [Geothrix sp. 21YS21S-4]